jgi:hypothetical protein
MNAGQILGKKVTLDYEGLVAAGSMLGTADDGHGRNG